MKNAIIYTRVSSEDQNKNYSLGQQEDALRSFCRSKQINVIEHFQDDESAKTFDRSNFGRALEFIKKSKHIKIDYFLVSKWDRFSRSGFFDSVGVIDKLQKMGVQVQSIDYWIDWDIPEQVPLASLMLSLPHAENMRRSLNIRTCIRRAKQLGRYTTTPPVGYKWGKDAFGISIIIPSEKAKFVTEAFREVAKGLESPQQIFHNLQAKGFKTSKTSFHRMLRNKLYIGVIRIEAWKDQPEETADGRHEHLIDKETFYQVQDVLDGKRKNYSYKAQNELFPLKRHLRCKLCDGNLTGSSSRSKTGSLHHYYHCQPPCGERFRAKDANEQIVNLFRSNKPVSEVSELFESTITEIYRENEQIGRQDTLSISRELNKVDMKLMEVERAYHLDHSMDEEAYKLLRKDLSEQKSNFLARQSRTNLDEREFKAYIKPAFKFISRMDEYYLNANLEGKNMILSSIFPDGLIFDGNNYRTPRLNEVLTVLRGKISNSEVPKKEQPAEMSELFRRVPRTGIEPVLQP